MSLIKLCKEGDLEGVKAALQRGADVNTRDNKGQSALHGAVRSSCIDALELLLSHTNIDVNIVGNDGESAVHHAVDEDNIEALKLLLNHPGLTALTLNQKDNKFGEAPVMRAVDEEKRECLELLAADLRVDLDTTNTWGNGLDYHPR